MLELAGFMGYRQRRKLFHFTFFRRDAIMCRDHVRMRMAALLVLAAAVVVPTTGMAAEVAVKPESDALQQARTHLQKGRLSEAVEAYRRLAVDSPSPEAVIGLSRAYEGQGEWDKARQSVEAAIPSFPGSAELPARLAEIHFRRGQFAEAEKHCQTALKQDGDNPLARLVQADVLTETGRFDEANEAYRWFVRYYNRVHPEDAGTLLVVARGAAQYARWNNSTQIFRFIVNTLCPDALADDENCWQAYFISGSLLLEKYNREQALPEFQRALAINPRAAEVLVALGQAALQQQEHEEAVEFADRALQVNPQLLSALQLKAEADLYQGRTAAALELLSRAGQVNPHDQTTLALTAAVYLLEDGLPPDGRFRELLQKLDAIDQVEVNDPGRFEELLISMAKTNPRPAPFLTALGRFMESRRKFDTAEILFKRAIELMPQLAEPKTSLGMLYMQIGRTDEARGILDEAFEADPYHVRVSNMRKVIKLLDDYEVIATDHFVLRLDSKADRLLGRYMAEYLEKEYPVLVKKFGFEPPQRTQFEIYHNAKGLSAHQWFSARMVGLPWVQTIGASTGVIVALASPTAGREPYNWARVLRHEFVHILTLQQTNFNIPHWFTEALAVASEGYPRPPRWNELLLERVPAGRLRNLDNLNEGFTRADSAEDWQFAYCQSRLYLEYMIDEFGEETVPKLLDAYRRNLSTDQAIVEVFGIDKAAFEDGYRKYLNAIVAELQGSAPEPNRTFVEIEKAYRADPENPKRIGEYAYALLDAGRKSQARELALQAVEKNPSEPLAATVLAELELASRDLKGAAEYLVPALDKTQPNRHVLQLLANIRTVQRQYAEAEELFLLGRKTFPYQMDFVRGLAVVYLRGGQDEKLTPVLQTLADMDWDDVLVRKKLAELALKRQDDADAKEYATAALHIDVLDPQIHEFLGRAHAGLKEHDAAIREFQVALELNSDQPEVRLQLAQVLKAAGRAKEAKAQLVDLLKRDPDNSAAQELLKTLP